jgi:hypothetical protein
MFLDDVSDHPSEGIWGDTKDLCEAAVLGCLLCQDLHRAFSKDFDMAADRWSVPPGSITYDLCKDDLLFSWGWEKGQFRRFLLGSPAGKATNVS